MKNFKRTLALVIAVIMVIGCVSVSAAGAKWYSEAVAYVESKGIAIIGANADKKVTRNDFVLWVAKLESRQLSDSAWNQTVASVDFSDVTDAHHKAAIAYSKMRGFIIGNGDGTFSPDKALTYAEACAVIVRVMGYENKVADTSSANWAYNYMHAANTYAHAIDATFMAETDTYNPDYELSQAEAAYLLASIMNFGKAPTDPNYSVTADGISFGDYDFVGGSKGKAYYVAKMDRVVAGESLSTLIHLNNNATKGTRYTNELDTTKDVVLVAVDGSGTRTISGAEFVKLVRVSLGLAPVRNMANEEAEINIYATVDVGSIVNLVIDGTSDKVTALSASAGSVIVDTYLQATSAQANNAFGDGANGANATNTTIIPATDLERYVGWTIREIGSTENTVPVLPASYSEANATSWTNVVRDAYGVVTSATLNFRGQAYKAGTEISILAPTGTGFAPVSVDVAVKSIINAAQGEASLVFNDEDGDGRFDTVIVKESDPFLYVGTPNVAGSTTTAYDYYSSISNGQVVGNAQMKGNAIGAVIYNKNVEFAQGGTTGVADYRTDGYSLKDANTGKLQLVLRASNKHFFVDGWTSSYGSASPHFYKVVDIADFGVGVIEEVDAFSLNDYFVAKIRLTDDSVKTVYIPSTAPATTKVNVSVAGATAEYVFDSSAWCTFLSTDMANAIANGIVSAVDTPAYKSTSAAWMAGKYVQFATDAENKVICILGTDTQTSTSGFVTKVEKTETGASTFNVTIATSAIGNVSDTAYYLHASLDAGTGEYRIDTPFKLGNGSADQVEIGKINLLNTTGIWYFQNAGTTSTSNNYALRGYNQSKHMLQTITGKAPHNTTIGLMNEAINSTIYNATADRANGKVAAWTVDASGNVFDDTGKQVIYQYVTIGRGGVSGLTTVEVRANASSMFGWADYATNHALFSANKLISPAVEADSAKANRKVTPGEDLIYVTVAEDAGSKYLKAGDLVSWPTVSRGNYSSTSFYNIKESGSSQHALMRFWASKIVQNSKPTESWVSVEGEHIIALNEIAGTRVTTTTGFTADYTATVGFGPYYERSFNAVKKAYEYVLKFTSVVEYTGVTGSADAVVDATKCVMTPLYLGVTGQASTQVKATTAEDLAKYTIANGYYVDEATSLVYKLDGAAEIVYKKDSQGKPVYTAVKYDWAGGTPGTTYTSGAEVLLNTYKVGKYATFTYAAKDSSAEGWFPGSYNVTLDGKVYSATKNTTVTIVTPSANGFTIETTTLDKIPAVGLFVTDFSAAEDYGKLTAIAVVGETATEYVSTETPSTPVVDDSTLVYLDASAKGVIKAAKYGTSWLVVSDKSAYALPSGEDVGVIYREYSTYEEATKAESINLTITGGHWYKVDANGKILADVTAVTYNQIAADSINLNAYKAVKLQGSTAGADDGVEIFDVYVPSATVVTSVSTYASDVVDANTSKYTTATVDTVPAGTEALYNNGTKWVVLTIEESANFGNLFGADTAAQVEIYNYKLTTGADAKVYDPMTAMTFVKTVGGLNIYTGTDGKTYAEYADLTIFEVNAESYAKVETSATLGLIKTGTLTSTTASGKTIATMNGVKNVDISAYDFEFFYKNAEKTVLYKAGNSTDVNIANEATYTAQFASEQNAYNNALAAYNAAVAKGYLSAERLAYYKAAVDAAEAALTAKKNSLLDKYFNGQFWNVPASPYYKYVAVGQGSFQQEASSLTFNYVVVGDTYCVFSDEFVLG